MQLVDENNERIQEKEASELTVYEKSSRIMKTFFTRDIHIPDEYVVEGIVANGLGKAHSIRQLVFHYVYRWFGDELKISRKEIAISAGSLNVQA